MAVEGVAGFFVGMMLVMILLGIAWFILIVWSLVDLLKAGNDSTWKILWVLVIVLVPFLGVILYYFIGKDQKTKKRSR